MSEKPTKEQFQRYIRHVNEMESYLATVRGTWNGYSEREMKEKFRDVRVVARFLESLVEES